MYKYAGNRVLSTVQNALVGLSLSEWHSGYRAYRVDALGDIAFESYSDDFDFDTEIILGLHGAGKTIHEVPIPTYYGDEICYVNGVRYAKDVTIDVLRYRLQRMGFGHAETDGADPYELKLSSHSSHAVLLQWISERAPGRLLDVGCSDGKFGELVRQLGHQVTGVDMIKHEGVGERLDGFVEADLNKGLPGEAGGPYDCIVAADVLEHTVAPEQLLADIAARLAPGGSILVSVPNFAHWYPRARVAAGRFDYDQRGLLDRGHVRFFTRRSFERLVADCDLQIVRRTVVGSPIEDVLDRGGTVDGAPAPGVRRCLRPGRHQGVADDVRLPVPVPVAPQLEYRRSAADDPVLTLTRRSGAEGAANVDIDGAVETPAPPKCVTVRPADRRLMQRWSLCGAIGGLGPFLLDAVGLRLSAAAHSGCTSVRIERLRPSGPRIPRRRPRSAGGFAGHRRVRHRRPDVHVLPAVPGAAPRPGADAHRPLRRSPDGDVHAPRLGRPRRSDGAAVLERPAAAAARFARASHARASPRRSSSPR